MPADNLTATLEEIRGRHRHGFTSNPRRDFCYKDNQDWPCEISRLLAAIEAVLAYHQPIDRTEVVGTSRRCRTCAGLPHWPCAQYLAISRSLSCKEESDG